MQGKLTQSFWTIDIPVAFKYKKEGPREVALHYKHKAWGNHSYKGGHRRTIRIIMATE